MTDYTQADDAARSLAEHQAEAERPAPVLSYDGGGELEQLHAEYLEAKAAEKAAADRAKAVTDRIKVRLTEAFPGEKRMVLAGRAGPPLGLQAVTSWKLNSKKLKADDPKTYVQYAYQSTAWVLRPQTDGD